MGILDDPQAAPAAAARGFYQNGKADLGRHGLGFFDIRGPGTKFRIKPARRHAP